MNDTVDSHGRDGANPLRAASLIEAPDVRVPPSPSPRDKVIGERLAAALAPLLEARPVRSNPQGLRRVREQIAEGLSVLGFRVEQLGDPAEAPILLAHRPGRGLHVALSAHYDVEAGGGGWTLPPFRPSLHDDRLFGRGTADNLGPLLLRFQVLGELDTDTPPLTWVIQGEEEIGSPLAHRLYPTLQIPPVDLWIEETGYFERSGRQRMLLCRPDAAARLVVESLTAVAEQHGRRVEIHDRVLNKAFGADRCPVLTHLVGDHPYLAIGPNDPDSRIHRPDESLPLANLAIAWEQFAAAVRTASTVEGGHDGRYSLSLD